MGNARAVIKNFSFKKYKKIYKFLLTMIFLFAIIYAQDVSLVLKFHILPLRRIQFFSFKVFEYQIFLKGRNSIRVTKVLDLELQGLLCPFAIKSVSYYHRGIIGFFICMAANCCK